MERRLSAIFVADMVGFSRLMEADEVGTLERQKMHRVEIIDPTLAEFHGHIVKEMGDGLLIEFSSVVEAVQCAVIIQKGMIDRETDVAEVLRIQYRIGINLGDIVVEEGDIFGDGVNIAARLEQLAKPGGICISGTTFDQLKFKLDVGYESLGEMKVKNIQQTIRAYHVLTDPHQIGEVIEANPESQKNIRRWSLVVAVLFFTIIFGGGWWWSQQQSSKKSNQNNSTIELPKELSIAVLPFVNISNDLEQDYFVDGMTEDLITDLSKISALAVISRTSTFAYKGKPSDVRAVAKALNVLFVVEGSVRKFGDKVRISAQLIDAKSGTNLWSERYDFDFDNIFAMQDKVRDEIVSVLAVKLTSSEEKRIARSLTNDISAYDIYLKGVRQESFHTKDGNLEAQNLFKESIKIDPSFASAYAHLAQTYSFALENNWTNNRDAAVKLALLNARKAVDLDGELPYAHWVLGRIYTRSYASDLNKAISSLNRAIELKPNYADGLVFLANIHNFSGHAEEAIPLIKKGMRINPNSPYWYHLVLGISQFFLGNYDEAVRSFDETAERIPTHPNMQRYLIASYGYLGLPDDAEWAIMEYESRGHSATIKDIVRSSSLQDPNYLKIFEIGLRKGGVPDE